MKSDCLKMRNHLDEFATSEQFALIEGMQQQLFNLGCNFRELFDFFADTKLSS